MHAASQRDQLLVEVLRSTHEITDAMLDAWHEDCLRLEDVSFAWINTVEFMYAHLCELRRIAHEITAGAW